MPFLDVGGSSLYYSVSGEGTPIVFIHPPLLTSANFKYQIEDLSRTYKVITFDLRGHGRSQYSEEPITYSLIAKDICKLLDHLDIPKAYLCGYSTGGTILLEFLITCTERSLGGIIISGMSEVCDMYLEKRISLARIFAKAGAIRTLGFAIAWGNSNTKEIFKLMFKEALKGDARNIEQYYSYSKDYNCTNQLESISHPVLLVYGTKDKSFHKYARMLHEKLAHSELKFIHQKHQIPTKSAYKMNQLIRQFIHAHD